MIDEILEFAIEIAKEAGGMIRDRVDSAETASKGFRDIVTESDLAAQKLIMERVSVKFPEHTFLAEEDEGDHAADLLDSTVPVWVIDPIDGTSNYSRGLPVYCVSIGVYFEGAVIVGVIYDPVHDELFAATQDSATTMNGQAVSPANITTMAESRIALDWSRAEELRAQSLLVLDGVAHSCHTVRSVGSAALAFCWITIGRIDGYYNLDLKAWDVAAGGLILKQAGCRLTSIDGRTFDLTDKTTWAVASNSNIYDEFLTKFSVIQPQS